MEQPPISRAQLLNARSAASKNLLQAGKRGDSEADKLTTLAAKRSSDNVKLTHLMLQSRLAKDLDETIARHVADNPEMEGKFFIGFISDGSLSTEVVDKDAAIAQLVKSGHPVDPNGDPAGTFSREDFPLKTPEDPVYRSFKHKLDQYLTRNQEIMQYLRNNPDANVSVTDFYRPPNS